jgi:type II restriction enzyme
MQSKIALDKIIKKSRVHFYKPIQIAEILFHDRQGQLSLHDLESYRNISKKWRDQITQKLIGRISTSSQKFQDNLFEDNAMPPQMLVELAEFNRQHNGVVEAFIYKSLQLKLGIVYNVEKYIKESDADTFKLSSLLNFFVDNPGLKRSIDKMYEITVFALFSTIVRTLQAQVALEIGNKDVEVMKDFERFIKMVLGLEVGMEKVSKPASLFRAGVTNAADRGLDMISNFGPVIQVKHLTLTPELAEDITSGLAADSVIIVCLTAEVDAIRTLLTQIGMDSRIQGIITLKDLEEWYELCLSLKYRSTLGSNLLADLSREFESEFPSSLEIQPFMQERKYLNITLPSGWDILSI